MRSEWSERLEPLTTQAKARMLVSLIDSTTANFIRYGYQVADRWRSTNDELGRGQSGAAVRAMIERGIRGEMPVLDAYGDMAKYALDEVRYSGQLGAAAEEMLARYVDFLDEVFQAVFDPVGTVNDYEDSLREFDGLGPQLSAELGAEL